MDRIPPLYWIGWCSRDLRRRPDGWYWTHAESAANLVDIRGTGGGPYQLIDVEDGTLVGTMDAAHAMSQGHPGAIYIHQNAQYVVEFLSEGERVILLSRAYPDYYTRAIESTEVRILAERARVSYGAPNAIGERFPANMIPARLLLERLFPPSLFPANRSSPRSPCTAGRFRSPTRSPAIGASPFTAANTWAKRHNPCRRKCS